MSLWEIEATPSGYDVRHDGKAYVYDRDDLTEALDEVRRDLQAGDQITLVHLDGYREQLDPKAL